MIQEPARDQTLIYDSETTGSLKSRTSGSKNCTCSLKRTKQTVTNLTHSTTTIPIVINTQPNPRIILIKVPTSKSNRTEQSPPRTRLIRIPFLPGSVPSPSSVNLALPTAKPTVSSSTTVTANRVETQVRARKAIIESPTTVESSNSFYCQSNRVATDPTLGPPTMKMLKKTVQVSSQMPQTLASMAGIRLTGADMPSNQDMSGAMPTATVEEIDVPVFIDEYLQNIEVTPSTSSSSKSEENEEEKLTETDIFDFDINLIAENPLECKAMDQSNLNMDNFYSDSIHDFNLDFELLPMDEEALDMATMCNGININSNPTEELDLENILIRSEDPIIGNHSQGSSQTKYVYEQPMLPDENSMEYYGSSQTSLGFGLGQLDMCTDEGVATSLMVQDASSTFCLGAKRSASASALSNIESMPQKRNKLMLNITKSENHQADLISTPKIIEYLLNFDDDAQSPAAQSEIYEDLRSVENTSTYPDLSPPNTPLSTSGYSASNFSSRPESCQTLNASPDSPASPAYSFTSVTTTNTRGTKRKRGRPAKEHADGPDPDLMSQMTDDERKAYQDRIKNNEASRVSRRKTKKREEEEKQEEDELLNESQRLNACWEKIKSERKRLEDYLMENHHKNSTYVKSEPNH